MCSISPSGESRGGVSKNPNPFPERGQARIFGIFAQENLRCGKQSERFSPAGQNRLHFVYFQFKV
ncbi:MAG: hypothetical protein LUH06_00335 [Oscillospiraceae bacterium]|nr:hypothetical protein [Oscillospiraceae bacterium]